MVHVCAVLFPVRSEHVVDFFRLVGGNERVAFADDFAGCGIDDVADGVSACNTVCKCFDDALFVSDCRDERTFGVAAILFANDDGVRYVDETSRKITRVSRLS